jgi:hypothetical protein
MNQYRSLENRIRDVVRSSRARLREARESIEKDPNDQIVAGTYRTKHFEMCPGAQKLFTSLPRGVNPDQAEKAAILHDQLFALEKQVISKERSTDSDIEEAGQISDKIRMYADMMGISDRVKYLDDHMKKIKKYREEVGNLKDKITDNEMKRLQSPPSSPTKEKQDNDIDNTKFVISRNLKAQRKLKIIDAD